MEKKEIFGSIGIISVIIVACYNKHNQTTITVVDDAEAAEVLFENVAKNIKIIPLEAQESLDAIDDVRNFGDMLILRNSDHSMLYIFDEGKFVAKLNAQGRGYGEKLDISSFTYSEVDRTLYVSTYEKSSNQGVTGLQFF